MFAPIFQNSSYLTKAFADFMRVWVTGSFTVEGDFLGVWHFVWEWIHDVFCFWGKALFFSFSTEHLKLMVYNQGINRCWYNNLIFFAAFVRNLANQLTLVVNPMIYKVSFTSLVDV